jgi:hypothetical protein
MNNQAKMNKLRNWIVLPLLLALVVGLPGVGFAPQAAFAQQATATPTAQAGQATATPQAGQATATPQTGQATATPQAQATQQIPQTGQQQGQTQQTAETLVRGNVGVFSPGGFDENTFFATRVDRRSVGNQPVNFVGPLIEIESPGRDFPNVLTYVFFNLKPGSIEKQSDRDQGVSIWFRPSGGAWERCANMIIVDDRTAIQMGMDFNLQGRGQTRIACVATRYNAIYGIGVPRNGGDTLSSQ